MSEIAQTNAAQNNTAAAEAPVATPPPVTDPTPPAAGAVPPADTAPATEAPETTAPPAIPADAYQLDGGAIDEGLVKWFRDQAASNALTQEQAAGLFKAWSDLEGVATTQMEQTRAEAETLLKAEWQGEYKANLDLARKTLKRVATADLLAKLDKTGLGNDPDLVRAFASIGKAFSEDSFLASGNGSGAASADPASRLYPNQK